MPGGQALGSEGLGRPSVPEPIGTPSRDSFSSATTPSTETPPPNDTTGGVEPLHIPLRIPALVGFLGLGYSGGQADPSWLRLVAVSGTNLGCTVSQFLTQSARHTFPLSVFHSSSPTLAVHTHLNSTPVFAASQLSIFELSHSPTQHSPGYSPSSTSSPDGSPVPMDFVHSPVLGCVLTHPTVSFLFCPNPTLPHSIPFNFNLAQLQPQPHLNFYNSIPLDFASPNFAIHDPNTALVPVLPQAAQSPGPRGHLPLHLLAVQRPRVLITLLLGAVSRPNPLFLLQFHPGRAWGSPTT